MKAGAIARGDGGLAKAVAVAEQKERFSAEVLQGERAALGEFVVPWKSGEEVLARARFCGVWDERELSSIVTTLRVASPTNTSPKEMLRSAFIMRMSPFYRGLSWVRC
jgi:hypothetical protein